MRQLILTAGLIAMWLVVVHAESGAAQGYETLRDIHGARQAGKLNPAFLGDWKGPSPAGAAPVSAVPGCPGIDDIKSEWVEHTDPDGIPVRIKEHLNSRLVQFSPILLSIHRVPYYLGVSRRGDLLAQADLEPGCRVTGTVAYYVIGEEGNPEINFDLLMSDPGREETLAARLAELRWFDLKDGRRHRWYNLKLAASRGWLVDEYGRPTPDYRPIETFTNGINELY